MTWNILPHIILNVENNLWKKLNTCISTLEYIHVVRHICSLIIHVYVYSLAICCMSLESLIFWNHILVLWSRFPIAKFLNGKMSKSFPFRIHSRISPIILTTTTVLACHGEIWFIWTQICKAIIMTTNEPLVPLTTQTCIYNAKTT